MKPNRKAARDKVAGIKTSAELEEYLAMLNLTDDERNIARMIFSHGWSRAKIAVETGYSDDQLKRKIQRIYDKMV